MSEGLKPCPFCGGEARIIAKPYEPKVCVGCDDDTCLGFSGLGWLYDSEKEATEAWNRRAERTCHIDFDEEVGCWRCSECGWELTPGEEQFCPMCGARMERGERYRLSVSTEERHTSAHMDHLAFGGSRSTLLCRECAAAVGMLLGRIREEATRHDR